MANEFKNVFSWSKSRDGLFNICKRKYFLNYYAYWDGWLDNIDSITREIYIMKNLSSLPMWIGSAVHTIAELVINGMNWPKPVSLEDAINRLRSKMESDWHNSINENYRTRPNKILGLQEHYYQEQIPEDCFSNALADGETCIQNLFDQSIYVDLVNNEHLEILETEKFTHFLLNGIKVWVVPDLIIRKDNQIQIVDWKTGKNIKGGTAEVQLGVYAIYCKKKWDVDPQDIIVHESNLRHAEFHERQITEQDIEQVKSHILRSAEQMKSLLDDPEENTASIDNFPMTEETFHCRYCNFRRFCDRENL